MKVFNLKENGSFLKERTSDLHKHTPTPASEIASR